MTEFNVFWLNFKRITMRIILLVSYLALAAAGFAQKQTLTLEDAVMQQYRKFYPEHIQQFHWRNSLSYAYLEHYTQLDLKTVGKKYTETLPIDSFNKVLNIKLDWFSGMEWKDANSFYLNNGKDYYVYHLDTKKGEIAGKLSDSSENLTLQVNTGNIAFTLSNNLYIYQKDGEEIAVTSNKDKNIVSGQAIARNEFGIAGGIFWSPKGNFLAFYQKNETYVANYPLLNIEPTPGELMSIKYPMAGQKSEQPRVGIYNLATKETVYFTPQGNVEDYLTNLAWTPDEKQVLVAEVNRAQNAMQLNLYDALTGAFIRTVLKEENPIWVEPEFPAYFYSNSSENFVWLSEKDGFMNLYLCNTTTGIQKQLTRNKWVTTQIVGCNQTGTEVYFQGMGESPLDSKLYAVNIQTGVQTCLTPAAGTHEASVSPDGKYVFDQYSAQTIPNVAQLLNRKQKIEESLLVAKNPMENYQLGTTEIDVLTSEDAENLYYRLIKPSNFDPNKKYPVLVYVYNGPHVQLITNSWYCGASLWMQWMAEQGYLVFTLDGRGSGNRGFAFEKVIHRQLGTHELKDQLVGVNYLKSLPYVDTSRLAIHGWSFGGFMTISMMLRYPKVFTTAVAGGPVTDWKYYEVMYGERYMDRPDENPEGYEQASLLNKTQNLEGKLLVIHGSIDKTVVPQHSLALLQSFIHQKKQMDFFMYPMHEHNVRGIDRVHLMTKVLDYIIEHNR